MVKQRCHWCGSDPLYMAYHDNEWGVPIYDDKKLFEFINLEGMQAGLSWLTVLRKREAIQNAFHHFDAEKIVKMSNKQMTMLLKNSQIIRNRLKINAVVSNANAYLKIREKESFSNFIWQFVDGVPKMNQWKTSLQIPVSTDASDKMAKVLKQHGFKFVGATICYAFMQAVGMVNDHLVNCFRHSELL